MCEERDKQEFVCEIFLYNDIAIEWCHGENINIEFK